MSLELAASIAGLIGSLLTFVFGLPTEYYTDDGYESLVVSTSEAERKKNILKVKQRKFLGRLGLLFIVCSFAITMIAQLC